MFLWVSSGPLLSLLFFFLLCFRSSFDISRVPCICSTCFCPKVLPFPFSPLLLCFCMYSFVIFVLLHLRVFLFVLSFEVAGSLIRHFLVSWSHLFCTCFVLWVVCKTCSQFICFRCQLAPPPFGQHLSFALRNQLGRLQGQVKLLFEL